MGYYVSKTLEAISSLEALKMAIYSLDKSKEYKLMHHSDRGVQYCSEVYVKLLKTNKIKISMTQSGDPLENAVAERINGILKDEYLLDASVKNFKEATQILKKSVDLYNDERPHMSIGNLTPNKVHQDEIKTERLWKKYYKKKEKKVPMV